MRIVAGQATDAWIGSVKTFAIGKAVRLKAHIDHAMKMTPDHSLPTAMTLAAKAGNIFRSHLAEFRRSGVKLPLQGIEQMSSCASVTVFAGYPGLK